MDIMDTSGNLSEEVRLAEISKEISGVLLPNTVFLALCIFIGVLGNAIVVFVYTVRLGGEGEGRYFVPYLALVDAFSVSFSAGFNLSFNLFPVNYNDETLCKCGWFLGYLTTVMSVLLLPVIAVQRYLKICKPLGRQMSLPWKRFLVFLAFLGSVIVSVPSYFTYGLDSVEIEKGNITGNACRRLTSADWKTFSLIHSAILTSMIAVIVCLLLVLYVKVGKQIYFRYTKSTKNTTTRSSKLKEHRLKVYKVTLMFMLITAIFFVCFVPKMILFLFETTSDRFWDTQSSGMLLGLRFVDMFFVVNNIANPIVYAFMDDLFSAELKQMLSCRRSAILRRRQVTVTSTV